jgi:protein SCO1/2
MEMNKTPGHQPPRRYFWRLALVFIFVFAVGASMCSILMSGARLKMYPARGIVREIDLAQRTVTIQHEAVPGFMPVMTMPFAVTDARELNAITVGDTVAFRITVTAKDGWIDHLQKLAGAPAVITNIPTTGPFRLVRDVDPLNVGDPLPDYGFTNELGQPVRLSSFHGQALAITFIFTRCPYPTFCPRMSELFHDTLGVLARDSTAPTNIHFVTVSFDPDYDTPEQLKLYAEAHGYDPQRWNFLTGQLIDITALADCFGMKFWHEGGGLSHNLRTAVVDANGRVQKVLIGNNWTPESLAAELAGAARQRKTSNSKIQAPEKLQTSSFKNHTRFAQGVMNSSAAFRRTDDYFPQGKGRRPDVKFQNPSVKLQRSTTSNFKVPSCGAGPWELEY